MSLAGRTIHCPRCGYPAEWPRTLVCTLCSELLVKKPEPDPPAGAAPDRPAFPESLRRKLEEKERALEERRRIYREWLRRQRRYHAASGAVLFAIGDAISSIARPGAPATLFGFLARVVLALLVGAGIGLALNRYEGGRFLGAVLFLAGYLLHVPFLGLQGGGMGLVGPLLYLFCGALVMTALGGMLGTSMESDHAEKGIS